MSSNMKFTPDPYTTRQNQIITGETQYNGRMNLEEPENVNARFEMFEKILLHAGPLAETPKVTLYEKFLTL